MAKKKVAARGGREAPPDRLEVPAPGPLTGVLGQDRALATLDAALRSGRIHHAWIFHGPVGVGKFTAAMAFAGVLLDETTGPDLSGRLAPDPDSEVQRLFASGSHPDLHVIVKELARFSADQKVRDQKLARIPSAVVEEHLLGPAYRRASVAPGGLASKVFIVDEAELLAVDVQNKLLKTLEEPPDGTVLILVTSSEERLLPTIRSRCQRVSFGPLNEASMAAWLDSAGLEIDAGERDWLVRQAGGAPGRVVRAIEGSLHAWHRTLSPMLDELDAGGYPVTLASTMSTLTDEWAKDWVKRGEKQRENRSKDTANRLAARQMLALVAEHYRDRLRDRAGAERAADAIDRVAVAERNLASNVQVQFVMEDLVAGLAR